MLAVMGCTELAGRKAYLLSKCTYIIVSKSWKGVADLQKGSVFIELLNIFTSIPQPLKSHILSIVPHLHYVIKSGTLSF